MAFHSSKPERTVVHTGGQAEAVFGQRRLAAEVAAIHRPELADGDVALVDEDQGVVGQIFEQGGRRLAGLAAGEIARIVLDAGAAAGRLHHLEIEGGALFEALGLEIAAGAVQLLQAGGELGLDGLDGLVDGDARGGIVRIGVDADELALAMGLAGQRVELDHFLDLVAEEGDAPGGVVVVGREDLDRVAAHTGRRRGRNRR